jgi:uncharacterized repeat protein (TIGR01451 family)
MQNSRTILSLSSIIALVGLVLLSTGARAATVSINPPADGAAITATDLTVTTSFSDPAVTAPATVQWTIVMTNTGSTVAHGISVTNVLPVEFRYTKTAADAELISLGDLAPGDTIVKTLDVAIPSGTPSNRYVDEATVSAANVPAQESDAALTVNGARVLGASDTNLAETGVSPWILWSVGLVFVFVGITRLQRAARR